MFGTIRKHQTWLWAIIITVIVISFVIYFSPYSRMNDGVRSRANYGSIEGQKVSQEQFANAWREVQLRYFFMSGRWPDDDARKMGFDPERDSYQWMFLNQKAEQAGVHVAPDMVALMARQLLDQFQRSGIGSPAEFVSKVLEPRGLQLDDFERYVRHSLSVQEFISVVGVTGKLVTPQEARNLYAREHEDLSVDAVFFSSSNHLDKVTVTPEAVATFYTNHQAEFRTPERVQVGYVQFGITNLLSQAEAELAKTNLSQLIDASFQRLGTNFVRLGKTPEEAKAKIRDEFVRNQARALARTDAVRFANELFEQEPVRAENLNALAAKKNLKVEVTAPFDRKNGPVGMDVTPEFITKSFSLNPTNEPFAGPLVEEDGVYIIAYKNTIPSQVPPLDQIRDRVTNEYKADQAVALARKEGAAAQTALTNAVSQGKSFSDAAKEANIQPVSLPPFSISTRSVPAAEGHVSLSELKQLAFGTAPGKLSAFEMTSDGGMILFVKAKLPLDETKVAADMPTFMTQLRQQRQNEAFNDWFRKEAERALRDTPAAQQKQQPASLGANKS